MGVVISRKPFSVISRRSSATTWQRRMMLDLTAGFRRSRNRYLSRTFSSASLLLLISKGSWLWVHLPSTSIFSGTTSISPVGSLAFLLSRSRTVPVTDRVDSLFTDLTARIMSSVSMTTWVVP